MGKGGLLGPGNFSTITCGKRVFYLHHAPVEICSYSDGIEILLEDDNYVIANGVKCFYRVHYDAKTDRIYTHLKDVMIDNKPYPKLSPYSFRFDALEFPLTEKDTIMVVPNRDYSEVANAFLSEFPDLHDSIRHYLLKHPESYDAFNPNPGQGRNMYKSLWLSLDEKIKRALVDTKCRDMLIDLQGSGFYSEIIAEVFGTEGK